MLTPARADPEATAEAARTAVDTTVAVKSAASSRLLRALGPGGKGLLTLQPVPGESRSEAPGGRLWSRLGVAASSARAALTNRGPRVTGGPWEILGDLVPGTASAVLGFEMMTNLLGELSFSPYPTMIQAPTPGPKSTRMIGRRSPSS